MPPYVIVECYVPCADAEVGKLTDSFRALLYRLGLVENEPGCHRPSVVTGLVIAGRELEGQACFGGYTLDRDTVPQRHWMCMELGFETEGDEQYLISQSAFFPFGPVATYIPGVGQAIWQVM